MDKTKLIVNKINQKRWIFMWILVFLGYILFLVNWMIVPNFAGNVTSTTAILENGVMVKKTIAGTGWLNTFFGNSTPPSTLVIQATNYTATFIRGIGALVVGWFMMRLTHKWTTIFSIAMMLAAVPAIWVNNYWGFIFFRMLLAFGGSMTVILLQPIKSLLESRVKKSLNTMATFGFSIGAILSFIPFIWSEQINLWFTDNWQIIATLIGSSTILLLIAYLIIGQNFLPRVKEKKLSLIDLETGKMQVPNWKVSSLLKEWKTYVWIVLFGTFLVLLVMPVIISANLFGQVSNSFEYSRYIKIWVIVSLTGVIIGPWTIILWLKTNFQRKPFIIFILAILIVTLSLSFLFWKLQILPIFFILGFIFGWLVQSIQGVILYLAHEDEFDKAHPKRLASFYGIIWGFGYWVFTIFNIIISLLNDHISQNSEYWILLTFIIAGLLCIGATLLIQETKPEGKIFSFKRASKANKKFLKTPKF